VTRGGRAGVAIKIFLATADRRKTVNNMAFELRPKSTPCNHPKVKTVASRVEAEKSTFFGTLLLSPVTPGTHPPTRGFRD